MNDDRPSIVIRTGKHGENPTTDGAAEPLAGPLSHEHAGELPPGWTRPRPEHVPRPTYWPSVMGVGITMLGWGFITTPLISLAGLLLFVIALAGWTGEIRHEQ